MDFSDNTTCQDDDDNLLDPISTEPPPFLFERRRHIVKPQNMDAFNENEGRPIQTNKFYTNMMLEGEQNPIWPLPYGLRWERGQIRGFLGLSVSHADNENKVFGPDPNIRPIKFYINSYVSSLIFSAAELDKDHKMTLTEMSEFHTNINIFPSSGSVDGSHITVFASRGMSFITAEYKNLTPVFNSEFDFKRVDPPQKMSNGWIKYKILLEGDMTWLLYASSAGLRLKTRPTHRLESTGEKYSGIVQVAKVPRDNPHVEKLYDENFGTWPMGADLIVKNDGTHIFKWKAGGNSSKSLLLFSLPHHRESFFPAPQSTDLQLFTTTKGLAKAYLGNTWIFRESELDVEFLPKDYATRLTLEKKNVILEQAKKDLAVDFVEETTTDSVYFSGKRLAKMSWVCLLLNKVFSEEQELGKECIEKLKRIMDIYARNLQQAKLVYETTWKGVVAISGFTIGPGADFGNTWYNDHHFHYGYLILAASILSHLDESWGITNDPWIMALVRDVANPSAVDPYFPMFRAFDWYVGHSWAKGIFPSADGKDEESTSEDVNFYYSMKLYGLTSKRKKIVKLANTMLAVLRRSIRNYFLMEDGNQNHPPQFSGNKVTGILFENKVDYATYFSPKIECIHGIQMLPATPITPYTRSRKFVTQEWKQKLAAIVNSASDSWKSILYANYAQVNPEEAYQFFLNNADMVLDDGLSRTWALFWSAVGGGNVEY